MILAASSIHQAKLTPEAYTHISIDAFQGRSVEAKRNLYKAIVDNLEPLGIPKDHVKILLREIPQENWGIRGGQAACDVDLGFNDRCVTRQEKGGYHG